MSIKQKTILTLCVTLSTSILFLLLANYIFNHDVSQFQQQIFHWVSSIRTQSLNTAMLIFTKTANPLSSVIVTCLLSFILWLLHYKTNAILTIVTIISIALSNSILKHIFMRQRPSFDSLLHESGFSFPSGHSMISFGLALLLTYLCFSLFKNKFIAIILSILSFTYAIFIGFSRVYISVHYVGDVLGGWLASTAVFFFIITLYQLYLNANKKRGNRP